MATYISRQLRGKRYAYTSSMVGKSEKQRNSDELFHYLINDPDPERKWNGTQGLALIVFIRCCTRVLL